MQTTDLFLGLLASKAQGNTPFPQKADSFLDNTDGAFQKKFAIAVSRTHDAYGKPKSIAHATPERTEAQASNTAEVADRRAQKAESNVRADENRDRQDSERSADREQVARADKAQAADKAERQTQTDSSSGTAQNVPADANAEAAEYAAEQDELNAKLEAIIEKLEKALEEGVEDADQEELAELMVNLLAMLLAKADDDMEAASELAVGLNLDPNSELAKLLDMLLAGQEGIQGKALEDVQVLLKLSDEKGLLIPLSEIIRADGDESDAMRVTVQLGEGSGKESLELTISAEDLNAAKLVDLTQAQAKESDLVLNIPLEKLAQAQGIESLEALAAKLQQDGTDETVSRLLKVLGMKKEDLSAALAAKMEQASQTGSVKVVAPLQTADANAKPEISTANTMFFHSDEFLKSLDMEALAKEITTEAKERRVLYERLQQLLSNSEPKQDAMSKMLASKSFSEFFAGKDWMNNFQAPQAKQDSAEWASNLFKEALAEARPENATAHTSSDRVSFLGRSGQDNAIQQMTNNSRTELAQQAARGRDIDESVMRQIIQRVSYNFISRSEGEVRVFLKPGTLGDVTLKVRVDQDTIIARITAQSHEVKAILESNLGQLKDALAEQGVKVGSFEVEVNTGNGGENAQNGAQDHTEDIYSSQYASGLDSDELGPGEMPEFFDEDYSYSRGGSRPNTLSRMSYLA